MVRRNVKGTQKKGDGTMQVEVFPQRLLGIDTARQLIDSLNEIDGIVRIVVHGPRMPAESPDDLLNGKFGVRERKTLNVMGEEVELTTQVGRLWIEMADAGVEEKIRAACEKALPFPFELYEGLYLRRRKTVSDYARRGPDADDGTLGMFDPKDKRSRCCGPGTNPAQENELA